MKTLVFMAVIILSLSIVTASELSVSPSILTDTAYRGTPKSINFTLWNNINENITNIFFNTSNLPFIMTNPSISSLFPGYTAITSVINCTQRGVFDNIVSISGEYFRKADSSNPATHYITIDSNGNLDKHSLDILKGDTVVWRNNWTGGSLRIFIGNNPEQTINYGSTFSYIFSSAGSFNYVFLPSIIQGGVITVNDTIKVIASTDLRLNISCKESNTSIIIDMLEPSSKSLNISWNEYGQAAMKITNTGPNAAVNLKFDMDWGKFTAQSINIDSGKSQIIVFSIVPYITSTDQTNKEYTKTLTVSGENIEPKTIDLKIFIPYAVINLEGGNISSPSYWIERKRFCDAYPTSPDCITAPVVVYENRTVYECPPIEANFSAEDVKKYVNEVYGLREDWRAIANILKGYVDSTQLGINSLADSYNKTTAINEKNEKRISSFFYLIFYGGSVILAGGIISLMIFLAFKYKRKKDIEAYRRW